MISSQRSGDVWTSPFGYRRLLWAVDVSCPVRLVVGGHLLDVGQHLAPRAVRAALRRSATPRAGPGPSPIPSEAAAKPRPQSRAPRAAPARRSAAPPAAAAPRDLLPRGSDSHARTAGLDAAPKRSSWLRSPRAPRRRRAGRRRRSSRAAPRVVDLGLRLCRRAKAFNRHARDDPAWLQRPNFSPARRARPDFLPALPARALPLASPCGHAV